MAAATLHPSRDDGKLCQGIAMTWRWCGEDARKMRDMRR